MFKQFEPSTIVFGARPVLMANTVGAPIHARDKKGRPIWHMPAPVGHAIHFKSAFSRAEYHAAVAAITASPNDPKLREKMIAAERKAKVPVPVYRGLSCSTARRIRATAVYRQKQKANQEPRTNIRSFMDGIRALGGKFTKRASA